MVQRIRTLASRTTPIHGFNYKLSVSNFLCHLNYFSLTTWGWSCQSWDVVFLGFPLWRAGHLRGHMQTTDHISFLFCVQYSKEVQDLSKISFQ
uniref:Uncharacterized protein n=1 Tax=Physcomitrium patens TaxID=3218 RepID=A0A2K1JMH8_PHYPA|nr:hypothetical protein PHYPA_017578 [Physcomitrium patens]